MSEIMTLNEKHPLLIVGAICGFCVLFPFAYAENALATPLAFTYGEELSNYKCDKFVVGEGRPLDLSDATITFEDDFDVPDIAPDGQKAKWYTNVHGGFGGAKFLNFRSNGGPFLYQDGNLIIRMEKVAGRWTSGLIQSADSHGLGFSQTYGYFEMRAKLPPGQSNWPAFWLKTVNQFTDKAATRAEIDVLEAYGGNDIHGYHATVHLWPPTEQADLAIIKAHWFSSCYRKLPSGPFDDQFHNYGAMITPEWVTIYYDRREIMRFKSLPEFRKPLFVLVDLAYANSEKRTDNHTSDMIVDYVRVWKIK